MTTMVVMTLKQLEAKRVAVMTRETARFEAAKAIRAALDQARKAVPADEADQFEEEILELVTEESE